MKPIENMEKEIISILDAVMKSKFNRELTTESYTNNKLETTYIRQYNEFTITVRVHSMGIVKYDLKTRNKSYYTLNFKLLLKLITQTILSRE